MTKESSDNKGLGICTVLGLIFITLKLTGLISWSWIWVLSPIWIGICFMIIIYFILYLILGR